MDANVRTDHAALTWLLQMKNPERQVARWPERLQQYHFEIRHRAGKLHNNGYRDKIEQRETSFYCGRTTVVEDEEWTTA